MFSKNVKVTREEVYLSPLAVAVLVGSLSMLDSVFNYLQGVKVERGFEAK
jgi:hypothetical protein